MARNSVTAYSLEARIVMGFDDKTLKQANQQIKREAARIQQSTAAVSNTLRGMMAASGAAFGAVAGGMTIAAATASKFEESFVAVKKTLNVGPEVKNVEKAFDQIANSLVTLSKLTPVTTKELNEIAAVGGQLGVSAKDIVAFTKVIQKLTVATNLGAEQAALSMARLQEITGSSVDELDNLGATLVDLGNNFAATESEIVNAAMQIATATAQISGTLNNAAVDALAFSTALRAIGQPAQAGATAIVRLMNEASTAVTLGGEKLELFASTAGVSMTEFVNLFEVDSTRAVAMFIKGLDDTSKVGLTSLEILSKLGLGQVRSRKAILALSKANETLFDAISTANAAFIENNALNLEAERRYDTLAMQVARLKNIIGAGFLGLAQDTGSLETAKNIVEEITNITFIAMENFEKISFTVARVLGPLMAMSTIFKQMSANVQGMAVALNVFGGASESINALNNVAAARGIPTGKSFDADVLFDEKTGAGFGMRGMRGSRISMLDKALAMPGMGMLGGMFGFVGGKRRRQENLTRSQYFRNRPVADAFMQGLDPFAMAGRAPVQTFDEFIAGGGNIMSRLLRDLDMGTITKEMFDEITTQVVETGSALYDDKGKLIGGQTETVLRSEKGMIAEYQRLLQSGMIQEGATESAEAAIRFQKTLAALNYRNLTMFDKLTLTINRMLSRGPGMLDKGFALFNKSMLALFNTLARVPQEASGLAKLLAMDGAGGLPQLPSGLPTGSSELALRKPNRIDSIAQRLKERLLALGGDFRIGGATFQGEFPRPFGRGPGERFGQQLPRPFGGRIRTFQPQLPSSMSKELATIPGVTGARGLQPKVFQQSIIKLQRAFQNLSRAIMAQTSNLVKTLMAAAARVSAAFVNLGGAFAGIGFILKNLKSLIQFSRSNFQFDFAKMGRSFIQNMALRAPKGLPAPRMPKGLPAPGPFVPFGALPASTGAQDVLRTEPARTAGTRAKLIEKQIRIEERLNKIFLRKIGAQKALINADKAVTKAKAAAVSVSVAEDNIENKNIRTKLKEKALRAQNFFAMKVEERQQKLLNKAKAQEALPSLRELRRQALATQPATGSTRSARKQLDSFLDGLTGQGNRAFTRGRRKIALRGLDNEISAMVEKSRELAKTGGTSMMPFRGKDVKVTAELAKNFDKAAVAGARFAGILKGIAKFGGLAAGALFIIAPLIKLISNLGKEAKGLEEYKNGLREITNEFQELANNTIKLAEARRLLAKEGDVFSPDGPTTVAETLEEYVKEQEKALAKQNKNISEQLGKAFIDGMLMAENDVDEGALASRYMQFLQRLTGDTEQQIKEQMAVPIGEAIRDIFEMGQIPTFQNIFDQLLFSEDDQGSYLSSFFQGTSRDIINALIGEDNPFTVFQDLYTNAIEDLDLTSFDLAQLDVSGGLLGVLDKYTGFDAVKGSELADRFAEGDIFQGITETMSFSPKVQKQLNELFSNLFEEFSKAMPDATNTEVAIALQEFLMFMETFNNLAGQQIGDISDTLAELPEDSDAMGALRDMLNVYLDEMTTAGYLSEREVLEASGNTSKMLQLYKNAQLAISNEITEANKKMQDEFGVTAEMSLRLAMKAKEAFKQIKEAATALGKPLQDAELTDQSFGKLLFNLKENRKAIEQYEKDIAQLRAKGFEFTADRLLQMGLAGRDVAARALEDPMAAQALEFELIRTAPLTASEAGVKSPLMDNAFMDQMENMGIQITESFVKGIENGMPLIRDMFGTLGDEVVAALRKALGFGSPSKVMMQFGEWTSMGFAEGIQNATPQTEVAMQNMAKDSAEAFRAILGINSNSTLFKQYGQNVANGFIDGLKGAFGQAGGVNATFEDFEQLIENFGGNVEAFANYITSTFGAGNFQLFLEQFMAGVSSKAQQYVSDQQKAFAVVTQLTSAERARNQALLGVMQSKASYAKQLREEASLQDRIGDTLERLNVLEQEGKKGNVTVKERIGILQKLLSLREMEKRAAGEFTAKEQLAINEKEQEVNTMARMYDQGVISALEFQAAQEELAEMRGEFKTEEDKELFFLQLADTEREYKDAQANALKIDQELVSTREEYFNLLDEQEQMTLRVQVAQDKYSAATEGAVEADMALTSAILYFEENIGPHMETLTEIADRYGDITDEVNELIEAVEEYQKGSIDGIFGPGGAEVPETAIYESAKDKAVQEQIDEEIAQFTTAQVGERMTYNEAKQIFGPAFKEAGLDDEFNRFITNPLLSPIFRQGTGLNMESNRLDAAEQFMTNADLRNIKNIVDVFNERGISRVNVEESGLTIMKQFIESLGLNLTRKSDGSGFNFMEKNLELVEDRLGIELGKFLDNFGDTFTSIKRKSADQMASAASNQAYIEEVLSGSPVYQNMDAGVEVGPDANETFTSPSSPYPALYRNSAGQTRVVTNNAARQRAIRDGYRDTGQRPSSYVPQGMMGLRTKGLKMGGRIPDMSHLTPSKYAHGGRAADHMMKRALVGEYGPEEVRFVPGSGFLVKPLTTGGRGNNTIVQNLSVNVTGVPVDNASARKAAIQIKKALQRLDREGNAGGGVRNV